MIIEYLNSKKEKLLDLFYILTPLSFFFSIRIFNSILPLFGAVVLTYILIDPKQLRNKNWKAILILIIPLIVVAYGFVLDVFYSNLKQGWKSFETFIPLIFYPLLISISGTTDKRIKLSKLSFFVGCIGAVLLCLTIAFWKNWVYHERIVHNWNFVETTKFYEDNPIGIINWGFFLYLEFASSINFHPTYLSVYFIVAIVFGVSLFKKSDIYNVLITIGILLLIIGIFLLSSKMSLITFSIIFILIVIYTLLRSLKRIQKITLSVLLVTITAVLLLFPASLYRIQSVISDLNSQKAPEKDLSSTSLHRLYLWRTSIELFKEKPWLGYGLFGTKKALNEYTNRHNSVHFNTHNQYLMMMLTGGIFGLLVFLGGQFIFLFSSIRAADYIYTAFLLIILLALLTENLISRHAGVVLYSFFNALFFIHLHHRKNEKI
jgi:O-antigen ligase